MFSFLNDAHEKRLGALLRAALPDVQVFLSSEVLPEIREYERASTTAVCAYVGPLLASYLAQLQAATGALGLPPLHVMGSSGGVLDVAECLRMPAVAVESGPAAGVVAAALVGRQLGIENVLSFDMGGTTAKASVIADGEVAVTADYEVGGGTNGKRWIAGTGHPIRVPVVDLAEVSAGGGSIAWIDPGGALKVGPHSAGCAARPRRLWSRRHAADGDGCECRARLPGCAAGWRAADRPRRGGAGGGRACRDAARPERAGGRGADHRSRQRQYVRRAAHRLDRARPRPARLQPDGLRRRRPGACRLPRRGTRGAGGGGAADPRRLLGARPGRHRPAARLRPHALCAAGRARAGAHRRGAGGDGGGGAGHAGSRRRAAGTPCAAAPGRLPLPPAGL